MAHVIVIYTKYRLLFQYPHTQWSICLDSQSINSRRGGGDLWYNIYVPHEVGILHNASIDLLEVGIPKLSTDSGIDQINYTVLELTVREVGMVLIVGILRYSFTFHWNSYLLIIILILIVPKKNVEVLFYFSKMHTWPSFNWQDKVKLRPCQKRHGRFSTYEFSSVLCSYHSSTQQVAFIAEYSATFAGWIRKKWEMSVECSVWRCARRDCLPDLFLRLWKQTKKNTTRYPTPSNTNTVIIIICWLSDVVNHSF